MGSAASVSGDLIPGTGRCHRGSIRRGDEVTEARVSSGPAPVVVVSVTRSSSRTSGGGEILWRSNLARGAVAKIARLPADYLGSSLTISNRTLDSIEASNDSRSGPRPQSVNNLSTTCFGSDLHRPRLSADRAKRWRGRMSPCPPPRAENMIRPITKAAIRPVPSGSRS